jgi:hypothetical protein
MLTAQIVVGRVVGFIVQKSAIHIAKLTLDKRKKACRSLTKLYYAVQALDDVTEGIFQTVNSFRSTTTGEAYCVMNALNNHMHEVALASNMFVDLGHELRGGLEIIDPVLADCCDALYISKSDFLSEMSHAVAWDRSNGPGRIILKMPRRTTDSGMLEDAYQRTFDAYKRGERHYWADTWDSSEDPSEVILTWEDQEAAKAFLIRLSEHREILVESKCRLRELLKSSFSVEELLFQTDAHPYR